MSDVASALAGLLGDVLPDPHPSGYDLSKPSRAVVTWNGVGGSIIWWVGGHIFFQLEGGRDLDDLGLSTMPGPGVWVWEGIYQVSRGFSYEYPDEVDVWPEGKWREPSEGEWLAIRSGQNPWNDEDWMVASPCDATASPEDP